jgi:hypothetical protein
MAKEAGEQVIYITNSGSDNQKSKRGRNTTQGKSTTTRWVRQSTESWESFSFHKFNFAYY